MTITAGKPDFYTILKRRRKSILQYLNELNITDKKSLENLINDLQNVYSISTAFNSEAYEYIDKLEKSKKLFNKEPEPPKDILPLQEENIQENESDSETVSVKKRKSQKSS